MTKAASPLARLVLDHRARVDARKYGIIRESFDHWIWDLRGSRRLLTHAEYVNVASEATGREPRDLAKGIILSGWHQYAPAVTRHLTAELHKDASLVPPPPPYMLYPRESDEEWMVALDWFAMRRPDFQFFRWTYPKSGIALCCRTFCGGAMPYLDYEVATIPDRAVQSAEIDEASNVRLLLRDGAMITLSRQTGMKVSH